MILYFVFLIFNPFEFWYLMGKITPVKPFIAMKSADNYPMRNTLILSKPLNISYIVEIINSKHLSEKQKGCGRKAIPQSCDR